MQHPPVVLEGAMDLFTLIVLAVIAINFVGPLFKAIAGALKGATTRADQGAARRLSQPMQQSTTAADARSAELDRLRRALLSSAGVADADNSTATPNPPPIVAVQPTPYTQPSSASGPAPLSGTTPIAAAALRRPSLQRRITITTATPKPAPAPVTDIATMTPLASDVQFPGGLMTLESAASAFQPLPSFAEATTMAQTPARPGAAGVLQGPNAGMNLFVAAAIIGPCAAMRPIGHTPGGW